ncbi:hypothetical protein D3C72_1859480 [compost metagenome]
MLRLCTRSYITPMQKNIAAETKPCDTICTSAPSTAHAFIWLPVNRNMPRVTKPMWEMEE